VSPGTYLIAVTRIETNKEGGKRPAFDAEMAGKAAALIRSTLELPDVKGIQIDFDAVASERAFYRSLINEVRKQTPEGVTLTMTSLASWCTGNAWFNDFPVDEAVPMLFRMGADDEKIRTYLRNGNDWREPLCRGSYGISFEEGRLNGMKDARRIYYFKNTPWTIHDIGSLAMTYRSICDITAEPERFNGQTVRFRGTLEFGTEGAWLTHGECPESTRDVVAPSVSMQVQKVAGHQRTAGIFTAVFKNSPFDDGCCLRSPFQVEVIGVEEAVKVK
jgi:hypothetical protein